MSELKEKCAKDCADALFPALCAILCEGVVTLPSVLFAPKEALAAPADKQLAEKLQRLEDELQPPHRQAQPTTVFDLAEAMRSAGEHPSALWLARMIPRLVSQTDATHTRLLAQALQSQARSLEALKQLAEAESAFALAGHLYTLAGQIQR